MSVNRTSQIVSLLKEELAEREREVKLLKEQIKFHAKNQVETRQTDVKVPAAKVAPSAPKSVPAPKKKVVKSSQASKVKKTNNAIPEKKDSEFTRKLKRLKSMSEQVIYLLKYGIKKAVPRSEIQEAYKSAMNLPEVKDLKHVIRNKFKDGSILTLRINGSRKVSYRILPEWVDKNGKFKEEFMPEKRYLPLKVNSMDVVRSISAK